MTKVVVIGAGVAGLVAAIELAALGLDVTLLERGSAPGGKMRSVKVGALALDAGPTVFTLKGVFEEVFAACGTSLADHLELQPLSVLARHAWDPNSRFDLFANPARAEAAIGDFAGAAEARRYRRFCADARAIYQLLENAFMRDTRPTPLGLVRRVGLRRLGELSSIQPFTTLWRALGRYFQHPRLRQLFGRYATYVGSSPYAAPATLMLIAHVEQAGVWQVRGGMSAVGVALANLARAQGVSLRCGCEVRSIDTESGSVRAVSLSSGERLPADVVVANADVAALAGGLFGAAAQGSVRPVPSAHRSLSAITWNIVARTDGFPLHHHSVFFGADYAAEFSDLFTHHHVPRDPTVYVCALDRHDERPPPNAEERLLCLINAPALDATHDYSAAALAAHTASMQQRLRNCGLQFDIASEACVTTTPADFAALYPGTGGALYGRAAHGWRASFARTGSRTALAGLYVAGGSAHPGPGLPMAALSGRLAAAAIVHDQRARGRA